MKVWVNGCFDILHHGHFRLLRHAISLGDIIVVGIDTDRRIKDLKGQDRPYHTQGQRKYNLMSIQGINKVIMFDTDDELRWHIQNENPDIMVIGSDYKNKQIIGSEYIPEIIYFDRINTLSTTEIIKNE